MLVGEIMSRAYKMKRRAEAQARTRERIVDAAVALHGSIGAANTTISAIAKRAGVQRATVYDHFPDEPTLFEACTAHYLGDHPPPDPSPWREIQGPSQRLQVALRDIYAYFQVVEPMMTRASCDALSKPEIFRTEAMRRFAQHWDRIGGDLLDPWQAAGRPSGLLAAAIGHAVAFDTWRQLVRQQGLTVDRAIELMVTMVGSAATAGGPSEG